MFLHGQSWVNSSIIDGSEDISIIHSTTSADGSTIVLGYFTGTIQSESGLDLTSYGGRDYFIAKFSGEGDVVWMNQMGSTISDYVGGGICACADQNIFVTGGFRNWAKFSATDSIESTGAFDTFLSKYDTDGNLTWVRNIGAGAKNQRPNALKVDESGNVLISGFFSDSITLDTDVTLYSTDATDDYFFAKFDPNTGGNLWARQIKGISGINSGRIFDIASDNTSYYFAGLYADSIIIENDTLVSLTEGNFDVHLIKTDLEGNVGWTRSIIGTIDEYASAVALDEYGDVYIAGWYDSPFSITVETNETETTTADGSNGSDDLFIAKYSTSGELQWIKTTGGPETDKIFDVTYYNEEVYVSGSFSGSLNWGRELVAEGVEDQDMFTGSLDLEGNYNNSNSTGGKTGELSIEEGKAIFVKGDTLSTVIASNTTQLRLGDDIYFNPDGSYIVAVGAVGCRDISIDNVIINDISGCYGDSTGSIQVLAGVAEAGFGAPYQYSIDDGENFQTSPLFDNLPASDDYRIKVIDSEGCVVRKSTTDEIIEPPELVVSDYTISDTIVCFGEADVAISVNASGGTGLYSFSTDSALTFPYSSLEDIGPGMYHIFIEDANGCKEYVGSDSIYENPEIIISDISYNNMEFNTWGDLKNQGEITISATGGTEPYTYTLQPGNIEPDDEGTFVFTSADDAGNYTVEVTDALQCGPTVSESIVIDVTILESMQGVDIIDGSIYPNPTSNLITIEFQTDLPELALEVISLNGAKVLSQQVRSTGGMVKEILDLSGLAKGTYLIRADGKVLDSPVILK